MELNESGPSNLLEIVTKAKRGYVACHKPEPRKPGTRGRECKKGKKAALTPLFKQKDLFTKTKVTIYGKESDMEYLSMDLLWGQGLYRELRFVLVVYDKMESILVNTDLTLTPEEIIQLYAWHIKMECCFREFKQETFGFGHHFRTKVLGKLNHFKKKEDPDPMEAITDKDDRQRILKTIDATERFVLVACISVGLVQTMLLSADNTNVIQKIRYLRTSKENKLSEATIMQV